MYDMQQSMVFYVHASLLFTKYQLTFSKIFSGRQSEETQKEVARKIQFCGKKRPYNVLYTQDASLCTYVFFQLVISCIIKLAHFECTKSNYLGTALCTWCSYHIFYFQYYDVFAKRKRKFYIILNEHAQVKGTQALVGQPPAITRPRSAQGGLWGMTRRGLEEI